MRMKTVPQLKKIMDLSKILAINGKNGLYELVSQSKNSFIVENVEDKKRLPAFQNDGISALDSIAIYTEDEEIALEKVFQNIFKFAEEKAIELPTNSNELKTLFEQVLPNYDKERVYVSNIKKVFAWYNILVKHGYIDLEEKASKQVEAEPVNESSENND